jgi:predicted ATPase/class 3 adenylate cyclase
MRCAKCATENPPDRKFCGECGARFVLRCLKCGKENSPPFKFCGECGAPLDSEFADQRTLSYKRTDSTLILDPETKGLTVKSSSAASSDGERKTVTALFADIKGSTELAQDLDPEEARAIIDPALTLMMDAVRRYDGYIVQSTGDGIFALFGAPVAHEDHPQLALYAAVRMQDEIRRYGDKLLSRGGVPIEIRVGANTGEVVVRSIETSAAQPEYSPIGHTTNLAARMQAVARSGSIVVSEPTRRLVEGYFTLKTIGPTRVRGITEPVPVYEVTGVGPLRTRLQASVRRGLTKFVGRETEIQQIERVLELVKAGHGQIIAVIGEPGVGKSRLFYEFKATSSSACMVLEAFSVSYGKASAYLPVIDLLHGYFEITPEDDARKRREKVGGKVLMLDRALEDALPYLFSLLGISETPDLLAQMDGQVKKRRTLDAIKRVLLRESLNQPLIVIFEDLHWIDGETQALLNLLADGIANAHILLMVSYRPEYHHEWGNRSHYVQLRLDPLGSQNAAEMLSGLLGESPELGPIKRTIIERSEGNPFFIEELVQALLDEGVLVRNGTVKVGRSVSQLRIPPTAQAVLAARIDRLPADQKELLETLSVVGREFSMGLIREVAQLFDVELDRLLGDLQLAEFINEQPAFPEAGYIFKHALTLEVAYNSILVERRKQLHERVGTAIEQVYASSIDDHLAELAHHYSRSGNLSKAFEYYERAGRQAVQRSAYEEAMHDFTTALELLQRLPRNAERDQRELALQSSLGPVLMATKGWAALETAKVQLRAYELAKTSGTPEQRFSAVVGWWGIAYVSGRLSEARQRLKDILDFVRDHPDPVFVLEACHHEWSVALSAGELDAAQRHVERGLALYEAQLRSILHGASYSAHHPAVCGHGWGALVLWLRGFPAAAQRHANQAVSLAQELRDSLSLAWALMTRAQVHQVMREVQPALEAAETAIVRAEGYPNVLLWAQIVRGWAMAELGKADEGVRQIREAISDVSAGPGEFWSTYFLAQLAEACGKADRVGEALRAIAEALEFIQQNGERWWEAEILRLQGELLLRQNGSNVANAQSCFERAIRVAREQGARSLELRAVVSLIRLWQSQGNEQRAHSQLAELYSWFTEGFDTPDLKDAKTLLDELRAS